MSIDEREAQRWMRRGQRFFRANTRNGVIRGTLLARGLSAEELNKGWGYYSVLLGFGKDEPAAREALPMTAAEAVAQLDAWDAPNYKAISAVLAYRHPAAERHLFSGVSADVGVQAVAGVERFLKNYEALASGGGPDVEPAEAAAAVKLLESRRLLDAQVLERLRGLIEVAKRGAQPSPESDGRREAAHEEAFIAFKNWLNEWREISRATFQRRDYLIMLGLAQRRSPSGAESDEDSAELEDSGEDVAAE